jgi:hypothetical protein
MQHTIKQTRLKGSGRTPSRNLSIKTDRGSIRLAIFTDEVPSVSNNRKHDAPPPEVTITLSNLLGGEEDPLTKEPTGIGWKPYPDDEGFYVRWKRGEGLSELYYGGEDTPGEFLELAEGAQFFGPFQIPL